MNNLQDNVKVLISQINLASCKRLDFHLQVIPVTWGLVTMSLLNLKNKLDWVVGSDLFFDPSVFEKLIFTIKW